LWCVEPESKDLDACNGMKYYLADLFEKKGEMAGEKYSGRLQHLG